MRVDDFPLWFMVSGWANSNRQAPSDWVNEDFYYQQRHLGSFMQDSLWLVHLTHLTHSELQKTKQPPEQQQEPLINHSVKWALKPTLLLLQEQKAALYGIITLIILGMDAGKLFSSGYLSTSLWVYILWCTFFAVFNPSDNSVLIRILVLYFPKQSYWTKGAKQYKLKYRQHS